LFIVPDATCDPRFADNPLVIGAPHIRFYAGAPLDVDGHHIGTLCVADRQPRHLDTAQRTILSEVARAVEHWLRSWREHLHLRDAQGLLSKIAAHVPGVFYQYRLEADGRSRFPFASAGVEAIYELAPEAVQDDARRVFDRLHPQDLVSVAAAIRHSADTLSPWRQQYRVCLPKRGERWLEGHATPELQADGAVLWCGFIHDITDRRAAESAAGEKIAAERASQAKSDFLSRVSHELRTPLNAVLGFTQLMQADTSLPARAQMHLSQVQKGGHRLLDLVNGILDLTRIERGFLGLRNGPVDVGAAVAASLALIEPLARQRELRLQTQGPAGLVQAHADARALEQVLLNLLSNGIKYNRDGGTLCVTVHARGEEVVISVSDDGPGLSAAQRSRLFQPFDRLGAEHGTVVGSGLGLVIAKQLVEAMHGRLTAHDQPGRGCRFDITLPTTAPQLALADEPTR
jgi:signal transduction histidine kinase